MTFDRSMYSLCCSFHQKYKKDFDAKFGVEGSKIPAMSFKDFSTNRQQLTVQFEEMKAKKDPLYPPGKLAEYSRWMANFNPNIHGRDLEIPGRCLLCKLTLHRLTLR